MTEELTVNIHKLRKENMSIRKIVEKLGVSAGQVHKMLKLLYFQDITSDNKVLNFNDNSSWTYLVRFVSLILVPDSL